MCVCPSHPSTLFPWSRHHGYPIGLCKRAPFPACGNAKQVPAKFIFCRYALQLLHLSFSSIRSHHPTRDDPGARMVALSKAVDEADVAISVVIVWRVRMLSARSPL